MLFAAGVGATRIVLLDDRESVCKARCLSSTACAIPELHLHHTLDEHPSTCECALSFTDTTTLEKHASALSPYRCRVYVPASMQVHLPNLTAYAACQPLVLMCLA